MKPIKTLRKGTALLIGKFIKIFLLFLLLTLSNIVTKSLSLNGIII